MWPVLNGIMFPTNRIPYRVSDRFTQPVRGCILPVGLPYYIYIYISVLVICCLRAGFTAAGVR